MLHVDLDRGVVSASVRDLAFPAGALPRSAGRLGGLRAELGSAVHDRYARRRRRDVPGFRAEVPLVVEARVAGVTLRLRGRADGLIDDDSVVRVEEVKSVDLPAGRLRDVTPADVPGAALQARLYAWMIGRERDDDVVIASRVVLVSLLDGAEHALDVTRSHDEIEEELAACVRALVASAEERAERARVRRALAGRLRFPYAAERPQQAELAQAVTDGLAARRPVLAEAPTGVGKTVAALLPALRHALEVDAVVLYATAKRTQRERVAATFRDIAAASGLAPGEVRALTLRPRQAMCPTGTLDCDVERCALLAAMHDDGRCDAAVEDLLAHRAHVSPDDVYAAGERAGLCPHVLSRVLCGHVDVVIGDYHHVYGVAGDPGAFPGALLPRAVVAVVDEAHNLPDRVREMDSEWLGIGAVVALERAGPATAAVAAETRRALGGVLGAPMGESAVARDGRREVRLDTVPWKELAGLALPALVAHLRSPRRRPGPAYDDPVVAALDSIVHLRDLVARDEPHLVGFAATARPGPAGVGVCCVDAAPRLERRHRSVAGTVLMSATLAPLAHARRTLGLDALDPVVVALPSPFPATHRRVVVDPTVDTSWRGRRAALPRIARTIERVVAAHRGHHAVFFPSHTFLADTLAHLRVDAGTLVGSSRLSEPDTTSRSSGHSCRSWMKRRSVSTPRAASKSSGLPNAKDSRPRSPNSRRCRPKPTP